MADLDALLEKTSRTFAIAIPLLEDPPRREVTSAYLLLRIADTFEDATRWPRERRTEALRTFDQLVARVDTDGAREAASAWLATPPCDHAGYLELLANTDAVLHSVAKFAPSRREIVIRHTRHAIEGMGEFVNRGSASGSLQLNDEPDLRAYCYAVAGIVGELLTDLFLDVAPSLVAVRDELTANAVAFGEGLQLVNILKDADDDARDGRVYLPASLPRSRVIARARDDLRAASEYVAAAHRGGAPRGIVSFIAFPVLLARATLDLVERSGAGVKVGRSMVMAMLSEMNEALDAGRAPLSG